MRAVALLDGQVEVRFRTEADCALVCVNDRRQNRPTGGWALVLPDDPNGQYANFEVACAWAGLYAAQYPTWPDSAFVTVRSLDEASAALDRGRL